MRFTSGWVKIHRKLASPEWSQCLDAVGKGILLELLITANIQPTRYVEGTEVKILERGQLLIGLRKMSEHLQIDRSCLTKRLEILKKMGTIDIESNHYGTKITICNYDKYQKNENDEQPTNNQRTTSEQPTNNQRTTNTPTPIEELKKGKNQRTKELSTLAPLGSDWLKIGHDWLNFALTEMPWQAKQKNWTAEAFGRELERVGKAMTISASGFYEILSRVRTDEFWRKNAASPFGLLKKSDKNGMRKIDNILVRLKTKQDREKEALAKFANSDYKPEEFPF